MKTYIGTCSDGAKLYKDSDGQFYLLWADVYYDIDSATAQQELRAMVS